jgi:hypothetical protein
MGGGPIEMFCCKNCGTLCIDTLLCESCKNIEKNLTSDQLLLLDEKLESSSINIDECDIAGQILKKLCILKKLSLSYIKNRYGLIPDQVLRIEKMLSNMKWIAIKIAPNQATIISLTEEGSDFCKKIKKLDFD